MVSAPSVAKENGESQSPRVRPSSKDNKTSEVWLVGAMAEYRNKHGLRFERTNKTRNR